MKLYHLLLPVCALSFTAQATSLYAKHGFSDVSRTQVETVGIEQNFQNGVGISAELKYTPKESEDGRSGKAFRHLRNSKKELAADYKFSVLPAVYLDPTLTVSFSDDKTVWKPALGASWNYNNRISLLTHYRYEVTQYDDNKKPDKHTHRVYIGAKYKFSPFTLSYKYYRYFSDQTIFARRETDYKHSTELKVTLLKNWQYSLEINNESVSKRSDRRQTVWTNGIKYSF